MNKRQKKKQVKIAILRLQKMIDEVTKEMDHYIETHPDSFKFLDELDGDDD